MLPPTPLYDEHPQDVLSHWLTWRQAGPVALVVISDTEGGSVRSQGSLMAVTADGRRSGYISGGCIDADVALRARDALASNETVTLRYGAGSPFIDMPLPCGGAIEIMIYPDADETILRTCHDQLAARRPAMLALPGLATMPAFYPKLRLRIAGRGADALALARLVQASGYELVLQLRDGEDVEAARQAGLSPVTALQSPGSLPPLTDDPWTAFVLMFHDADWETVLLKQALEGQAFYIGAVGSRLSQANRRERLRSELGDSAPIERIRGPVGLIPSTRDASMLAISTLAEIISAYRDAVKPPFAETALLLLAAGQSERFGADDKLLAPLGDRRVIEHAAHAMAGEHVAARIAVVGPGHADRRAHLESVGWQVLVNPDTRTGQASSIRTGIRHIDGLSHVRNVLILLADMPFVPDHHLHALETAMRGGLQAAISTANEIDCPPAIFAKEAFPALLALEGDAGAKSVYRSLTQTRSIKLPVSRAVDIDTRDDLLRASGIPAMS